MDPIIEELKKEFASVKFEKVNIDKDAKRAERSGVMSIPTFVLLKGKKEIGRLFGVIPKEKLVKLLDNAG